MNFTVYKSSAGSGKTFTLVKEYLSLALGDTADPPQRYKEILAITFTNKAAAEMKERIISALKELSVLQGDQPTIMAKLLMDELKIDRLTLTSRAKDVLKAILHNYADFAIGTIDSFTHRIVRAFAYDLHLPVNFEVETDDKRILREAVDVLISRIGEDEKLTEILVKFSEVRAEDEKSWQIEEDIRKIAQHLLREEGVLHAEKLRELTLDDFLVIRSKLFAATKSFEKEFTALADEAWQLLVTNGIGESDVAQGRNGIAGRLKNFAKGNLDKIGEPNANITKMIASGKYASGSAVAGAKAKVEAVMPAVLALWDRLREMEKEELSRYIIRQNILKNIFSLSVLNEVEKIILHFREEDNIIHISAFNRVIADVVFKEPAPFIYERLGEKYKNYLIDEFQDTSVVQWQNLLPLVDNALASAHFTMLVGDGKQAIYRWRGGDVEQFSELPTVKAYSENELVAERALSLQRNYRGMNLNKNFRSRREIVEFNNAFFRALAGSLGEKHRAIYDGLEQDADPDRTGGYIAVRMLQEEENAQIDSCMALVKQLLAEGWRAEQIAVLTRKNEEANAIATSLLKNNIPVLAAESLLLRNSPAVNFLLSVLRCIEFPEDELAGANAIAYLAEHQLTEGSLYQQLREFHDCDKNLVRFLGSKGNPLPSISLSGKDMYQRCEQIIRCFGMQAESDAFILFFLDELLHFVNSRSTGKADFFEWWEDRSRKSSVVVPDGMNAVSVMTIHKSKGLEFPVVIIPFADWEVKKSKDDLWIDYSDELVPKLKTALLRTTTDLLKTDLAPLYAEEIDRSLLDVVNELYVAMTRPVDRLYMFITEKTKKKESGTPKSAKDCVLDALDRMQLEFVDGMISIGEERVVSPTKKTTASYISVSATTGPEWKDRIRLRAHSRTRWENGLNEELEHGKLLHLLLEGVKEKEDVKLVVSKAVESGIIASAREKAMLKELEQIISDKGIEACFAPGITVFSEKEILLPDGTSLRPDRVTGTKENVTLLDYKTGKQEEFHRRQLDHYAEVLKKMGYKKVVKKLFYTSTFEMVTWS